CVSCQRRFSRQTFLNRCSSIVVVYYPAMMLIGDVRIPSNLFLAPMSGQTQHAFRMSCRLEGGVGLVTTELISSQAIHYRNRRTQAMFDWRPEERPLAVQLYGGDPAVMAEAARLVEELGADIVDINMGCWVPKVARSGGGAALLKDVCTAAAVVRAVVHAVRIPVTVKVRSGWTEDNPTAVPFARAAEDAGVAAIAVHARFASQGFSGQADWSVIARVKEAVCIPVIGNGDVCTATDVQRMLRQTGCDGVMLGRASLGNPWVFRRIAHELATGRELPPVSPQERALAALRHARLAVSHSLQSEHTVLRELRGQLSKYHLGVPGAGKLRERLVRVESMQEVEDLFGPIAEGAACFRAA
ncbi:MAG: tRNA dihydrouridine synthase DusB, partial [Candidatus Eremiobacterota bacterium]